MSTSVIAGNHPILSCEAARALEATLFGGDEAREWSAMLQAGNTVARSIISDFAEIAAFPASVRLLVLAGKGHNAGDALIAASAILRAFPLAHADVYFAFGPRALRPLAARAWREFAQEAAERVSVVARAELAPGYDVAIDGVFGFQFRPPAAPEIVALLQQVNASAIRFRAAVDLPSADVFRADFTYATGSVKMPVLEQATAGRVRYLDLGFFNNASDDGQAERVLTGQVLEPLRRLRPSQSDKRSFGHMFIVAGSRNYPGAALMAVRAALRSGVGLLTAFVPESMVSAFAAQVPEAIWVGWPETPDGGLALEGVHLLHARVDRANAVVIGPGIGRESETRAIVAELVASLSVPVLLDADALQPMTVRAARVPLVLTPHAGEFERIAEGSTLREYAKKTGATVVLKGPHTRIAAGEQLYHSLFGGPVLARGGSGDVLAGLTGGLLAQTPESPALAAVRGAVWHGLAADLLARTHGQVAVQTTQLLEFLAPALRG